MARILVSGCLLGFDCRYKGDNCKCQRLLDLQKEHTLIPVCPEQMGGLRTPRKPSERVGDKVMSSGGRNVTKQFVKGAEAALETALIAQVDFAILKAKSPSCGKGIIYDGTFTGAKIPGNGVTTELLLAHHIPVYTEEDEWPV
ncbi:MAG: DUF523 domain-containing protein [Solobacterium sp.]|nr:DUF523 domain-containing protein [Solobacterium sp.]